MSGRTEGQQGLLAEIRRLRSQPVIPESDYYCFTLRANERSEIVWDANTAFAGYAEERPGPELREPALVRPDRMRELLTEIGEPPLIVSTRGDFHALLLLGGHAIIASAIAEEYLGDLLEPVAVVAPGSRPGFLRRDHIPRGKLAKRPPKRLKQRVRDRDAHSCKLCGRSSRTDPTVPLSLHHITPRSRGGLTEEDNLITLCRECHDVADQSISGIILYPEIDVDPFDMESGTSNYNDDTRRYRRIAAEILGKLPGSDRLT